MRIGRFLSRIVLLVALLSGPAGLAQSRDAKKDPKKPVPAPAPVQPKTPAQPVTANEAAVRTTLDMKVVGVLAVDGGRDKRSSAMIGVAKSGSRAETYYPGQSIGGDPELKLVHVGNDTIEFLNHGRLEFAPVKHFPDAGSVVSSPAVTAPTESSADKAPAARKPVRLPKMSRRPGADGASEAPAGDAQDSQPQD